MIARDICHWLTGCLFRETGLSVQVLQRAHAQSQSHRKSAAKTPGKSNVSALKHSPICLLLFQIGSMLKRRGLRSPANRFVVGSTAQRLGSHDSRVGSISVAPPTGIVNPCESIHTHEGLSPHQRKCDLDDLPE